MFELKGKYTNARIYQNKESVEETCIDQIQQLIDSPAYEGCQVRIMPDCHTGVSCPIGTTIALKNKVIPETVSVDIGCGVLLVNLGKVNIDFNKLDKVIRQNIPSGLGKINQNMSEDEYNRIKEKLSQLYIWNKLSDKKKDEMIRSCGSLGT